MSGNINLSYIKELLGDDPAVVKDFVDEIIQQIKETELLIPNFIEERKFGEISAAAHRIKSILQMVGADGLYQKIHELETIARESEDIEEINSIFRSIEKLSTDCRRTLEEIL